MLATKIAAVTISRLKREDLAEERGPLHRCEAAARRAAWGVARRENRVRTPCPIRAVYGRYSYAAWQPLGWARMPAETLGWRHEPSNSVELGRRASARRSCSPRLPACWSLLGAAHRRPEHGARSSWSSALVINLGSYWFSDKIALEMSHAKPLSEEEAPRLHQIVRELAHSAGIPMPRLYMIPASQPNAFATGRSPKHAAVAVTRGHHAAAQRERAARRARARAGAHPQPRHADASRRGDDRRCDHLDRLLLLFVGGDDDSPLGPGRGARDGDPRADRRDDHPARDLAAARVRGGRHRRPDRGQRERARRRAGAARGRGARRCR